MASLRDCGRKGYETGSMKRASRAGTVGRAVGAVVERLEPRTMLAGTIQTVTTMGGSGLRKYDNLAEMDRGVVFTESYSGIMGITGGTPATTVALHTFSSGNEPGRLTSTGGRVFFTWSAGTNDELWSTDGTAAGTAQIPAAGLASDVGVHFAWGNKLFFAGMNGSGVISPWISDGTAAGTFPLIDTTFASSEFWAIPPTSMGGKLYFVASHDNVTDLYETDGTRAGTHLIIPTPAITNGIDQISNVGGRLLISDGFSLFTCTTTGITQKIGDYFGVREMTPMNGMIYFGGVLMPGGWQVYRTDGTIAGTSLVAPVAPGVGAFYFFRVTEDKLFFAGRTDAEGAEWWVSDGTLAGSHLITELVPGPDSPNTAAFIAYGVAACQGSIYFQHSDSATGPELWTSDGTAAGTRLVQDLRPGIDGSWPSTITGTATSVYFSSTYIGGGALFKYDPPQPPVATIEGTPAASVGSGPMTIQVRWMDQEGVDTSTLGNGDISVTLPDNTTVPATFVSFSGTPMNLVATYQIPAPPSPGWDFTYSGTYRVQVIARQVSDIVGRGVLAASLGSFSMIFAPPVVSNPLTINGTAGNDTILVQSAAGVLSVYVNGALTRYRSWDVTGIQINGLDGNDVVNAEGAAIRVTIDGGAGNDSIIGGSNNDSLIGGDGSDTINGGPGNDTIDGGTGIDSLTGGGGSDALVGTPTDISLSANAMLEHQPAGTIVGTLATTSPQQSDNFIYTLIGGLGSADNAAFQIAGDQLKTASLLDYETKSSYSIRVRSTNADGLFVEKIFTINVSDVNEPPSSIQVSPASVAENAPAGTTVGNLSVVDPDVGETYSYEILPGADQGAFAIADNQLKTTVSFDYEVKSNYAITVRVYDGANTFEQSLSIWVSNVNEPVTGVTLSNALVAENLAAGTTAGSLSAIDPDTAESYTYEILPGGDARAFTLSGDQLKTAASFNYESQASYSITVRVHDGVHTFDQPLTIAVGDVNEPPNSIQLSPTSVAENAPAGTTIGNLSVTDPDIGETYSYEIVSGVDQGAFTIAGNQLRTAASCDYEVKRSYAITVRVHDGTNTYDQSLAISVSNVNEAPTGITLSNTSVAENMPAGTVVGSLTTIDPDTGESYSYEILPGDDAGAFGLNGSQLKTAAVFNYETKASYSITVRVHDGAFTFDQPLTIAVDDVNEAPTDITLSGTSVPESQNVGTVVGTLSMTDPDSGESYTYEILPGADTASFGIVGNQLTTSRALDYETKASYSITIRGHDGSYTFDKPVVISVTNLPEFGMLLGKARPATIREADGDLVTFSLSGGGTGTVQPGNRITLAGTTAKSVLSVKVKKVKGSAGDGLYHLYGITSDGLIKSVSGTAVMLSGDVLLNTLDCNPGKTSVSMSLKQIDDANIHAQRLPVSALTVTGDVSDSRIVASGSIKKMSAATLLNSDILVGVATGFAGEFAASAGDFANPTAILGSLKVAGRKLRSTAHHPAYVAGSHISAPTVGTLTLLNVPGASGPVVHVLNDVGTLKVSQSKQTSEAMFGGGTWNKAGARPAIWDVVG